MSTSPTPVVGLTSQVTTETSSDSMTRSTELMSASDMTDISHVEIRDCSLHISQSSINPTTVSLLRCKKQIVIPFYKLLGIIAWRPFGAVIHPRNFVMKVVNFVYPVVIIVLLLFNYVTNALACRGESKISLGNDTIPEIPLVTPITRNHSNTSSHRWLDTRSNGALTENSFWFATQPKKEELWNPAYNECKHIFGTFILPSLLHLIAYCIGFYLYRIRQHEGLYVLMEKVFLQSQQQKRLYKTLWCFVVLGVFWLFLDMGIFVLYIFAFGPGTVTGFRYSPWTQVLTLFLMAAGQLVLDLVNVVIILNYAVQCQLVIHYIHCIRQRIEEKSTYLATAMKDILDVKNTIQRMNSLLSVVVSLCTFVFVQDIIIGTIYIISEGGQSNKVTSYRVSRILICCMAFVFPVVQAARVTTLSSKFKQISLDVRVFGHQTSSQLELDSFLVFMQSAGLKAKLFFAPVRSGYLACLTLVVVFTLLVLMHTGAIASKTKLF